ncbi:diguanylate phosphodiesterase [Edwardsiella piscicida]|uniref:Putative EaI protein n=1 Tax=Edwardsiella phage GF-2 TaxID=1537091 RepID=A0A077KC30_9CAUD|nr:diguanylate phosphodiesterase [Edwardsiella piscicida]YP_009126644.1 diguanylate phosphodiesterase [Edwardsiella phage GF-2]QBB13879.1 diguanylate phosphodiesterase [Edwardsiella piscicida]UCQ36430.1 diguanylate phosphodiesterase [Edwardsiella piscicida]BAP28912.1 putative EaI protein [Edwardsiella phage GF-2]
MKIGDHMEAVIAVIEETNGDNTDANLKLLSLIIAEYMINAEVTGFEVTAGKMKVSVEISEEG